MENQLGKIMFAEHDKLLKELNYLEENVKIGLVNSREIFDNFNANLKKHFSIEEKAIFELCNSDCNGKVTETFQLMREHGDILELVKVIENGLEEKPINQIKELKTHLLSHSNFENEFFYPSLDNALGEYTKNQILERVEMEIGNKPTMQ